MTTKRHSEIPFSINDPRLIEGIRLFNSEQWYLAHDLFEEIWHEALGLERSTIQGILQIAVAQVHLSNGNLNGATILYGEGLGRLKAQGIPDLGLDLENLCDVVEERLRSLQTLGNTDNLRVPSLIRKSIDNL